MTTDGTGYNPTMGATYGQMASYLSARSGLDYHVALNWLRSEGSQQRGNPLGANYSAAHGPTYYASWQQGLDAAIALLHRNPAYSRIIAAIRGGSPAAERAAIVASPWNGSHHYANGAGFPTVGIPGAFGAAPPPGYDHGSSSSSSSSSPGAPASSTASTDAALQGQINQLLQSLGFSTDPNHVISAYESERLTLSGMFFSDAVGLEGKTVGDLPRLARSFQASPGQQAQNAIADAIGAIPGALIGAVVPFIAGVAVLAVVGVLGWSGTKDLLGD